MTDRGLDKANGIHIATEHMCKGKLLATYDIGRYDQCPICNKHELAETDKIVEEMTQDELGRYLELHYGMMSSMVYFAARDQYAIASMRWLDYRNSVSKRLQIPIDKLRISYQIKENSATHQKMGIGVIRVHE